jgi:hypothetical protein
MKKFIITGSARSGTTLFASILNSQSNTFCLEDYPWRKFPKKTKFVEDFQCFSNNLDAQFLYLGLSEPRLSERANVDDNLIDLYISHLKEIFNCENVGFKRTMMTKAEMIDRISDGYKIIILKRKNEEILRSWVNRINTDVYSAADTLNIWLKEINYYSPDIPRESYIVINFDELISNLDKTLINLSKFLDLKIESPTIRYHSFNKNRSVFNINSSFSASKPHSLKKKLSRKYNDEIFKNIAKKIDAGNFKPSVKSKLINFIKKSITKLR